MSEVERVLQLDRLANGILEDLIKLDFKNVFNSAD